MGDDDPLNAVLDLLPHLSGHPGPVLRAYVLAEHAVEDVGVHRGDVGELGHYAQEVPGGDRGVDPPGGIVDPAGDCPAGADDAHPGQALLHLGEGGRLELRLLCLPGLLDLRLLVDGDADVVTRLHLEDYVPVVGGLEPGHQGALVDPALGFYRQLVSDLGPRSLQRLSEFTPIALKRVLAHGESKNPMQHGLIITTVWIRASLGMWLSRVSRPSREVS